jgi:hypothetical protein
MKEILLHAKQLAELELMGEIEVAAENYTRRHFVHHKSLMN